MAIYLAVTQKVVLHDGTVHQNTMTISKINYVVIPIGGSVVLQ